MRIVAGLAAAAQLAAALAAAPVRAGPSLAELVEVADISNLSVSPSGRLIAFRVERASIAADSYQLDWYVADLAQGTTRWVADGGQPIYGDAGPLEAETVAWSPDERFIFHRALRDRAIGLWRTAVDGAGSRSALIADADVEQLETDTDGRLTYRLGPSRAAIERAERREYDDGIRIDETVDLSQTLFRGGSVGGRMASQRLTGRWFGRAGLLWRAPRERYRLDLETLAATRLGSVDPGAPPPLLPPLGATTHALEGRGRPAIVYRWQDGRSSLTAKGRGLEQTCPAAACRLERISWFAWRPGTDNLLFATQDRFYRQSLHLWSPGAKRVRTVVRYEGLLSGSRDASKPCAIARDVALCVAAGATEPPRLERIDLRSGRRETLLDPNAGLRRAGMPRVQHIAWNLPDGRAAGATLLMPATGRRAPLFVTYYHCPGYLRGGTGDEFPLPVLAEAGFVAACVNMVADSKPTDAVAHYDGALAAVRSLVLELSARGWVDPGRVAMGGFSAGSEAAMWVAMKSDLLTAAAIASPQYEPASYWADALPGRDYARVLRDFIGLGRPDETPARWQQVSPALNAGRIRAPLLMQLPESEARSAAELYSRLAATRTPVELYAFPDEGHVKMHPRHRLAVYRRGFDWFRYWLQDIRDEDPGKAEQYGRWDRLKARRNGAVDEGQGPVGHRD